MSQTPLTASVQLLNEKLRFSGSADNFPDILLDYIPPLGEGSGYMPMQLLLISLSACSASSILTLLRRMGKTITACSVDAEGIRREEHPTAFRSISLTFRIESPDLQVQEFTKAVQLSADTYCPVWAMLKGNVEITATLAGDTIGG
ncbi:MAG: OsmC family protein [Bacteroidia bacterium]|nr:OsmC family protein [Bacteroidia bacterium]